MDVQFTIVEQNHLSDLCAQLARAPSVGIDTEFVRRRTFYPELGLIQMNLCDQIYLLDPLAELPMAEFNAALAASEWVLHSGSEDFEVLLQSNIGAPPRVFDTQLAAAFCGLGGQLSYQALCAQALGLTLAKDETQSDWLKRPLSEQQLHYAAADVAYLPELQRTLQAQLVDLDRLGWFEIEQAARLISLTAEPDPRDELKRYRQAAKLRPVQQQRLLRLIEWREITARGRNLPRAWVLEHHLLIDWAERPPRDPAQLRAAVSERNFAARREAEALFELLHNDPTQPEPVLLAMSAAQQAQLNDIKKIATERAAELNLPVDLLAPRKLMEQHVGNLKLPIADWRKTILGLT